MDVAKKESLPWEPDLRSYRLLASSPSRATDRTATGQSRRAADRRWRAQSRHTYGIQQCSECYWIFSSHLNGNPCYPEAKMSMLGVSWAGGITVSTIIDWPKVVLWLSIALDAPWNLEQRASHQGIETSFLPSRQCSSQDLSGPFSFPNRWLTARVLSNRSCAGRCQRSRKSRLGCPRAAGPAWRRQSRWAAARPSWSAACSRAWCRRDRCPWRGKTAAPSAAGTPPTSFLAASGRAACWSGRSSWTWRTAGSGRRPCLSARANTKYVLKKFGPFLKTVTYFFGVCCDDVRNYFQNNFGTGRQ